MTDGLQNEGLAPGDVDLSGLTIHAIGFGSESNLDGNMLSDARRRPRRPVPARAAAG